MPFTQRAVQNGSQDLQQFFVVREKRVVQISSMQRQPVTICTNPDTTAKVSFQGLYIAHGMRKFDEPRCQRLTCAAALKF